MSTNAYGNSPLHDAAFAGDVYKIRELIEEKADVNVCNKDDETPLHLATVRSQTQSVKLLLAAGANANAENKYGNTPLPERLDFASKNKVDFYYSLEKNLI